MYCDVGGGRVGEHRALDTGAPPKSIKIPR